MVVGPTHGAARVPDAKVRQVADLAEKLGRMRSAVLTDYRGLSVHQMEDLRASLRSSGVEYVVLKNTLARRASDEAGTAELRAQLSGAPIALAIGYDDLSAPARVITEYARGNRRPEMVLGGVAEGQRLSAAEVRELAELPSREVLMAQLLGTVEAAAASLVGLVQAPVESLLRLLEARQEQAA